MGVRIDHARQQEFPAQIHAFRVGPGLSCHRSQRSNCQYAITPDGNRFCIRMVRLSGKDPGVEEDHIGAETMSAQKHPAGARPQVSRYSHKMYRTQEVPMRTIRALVYLLTLCNVAA